MALGRDWRAEDDQRRRGIERSYRLVIQGVTSGEVLAVAKDGTQSLGDRACGGFPADKVLVDVEAFESPMQPLGPARVSVAVGDEGSILQGNGLGMTAPDSGRPNYGGEQTCGATMGQ